MLTLEGFLFGYFELEVNIFIFQPVILTVKFMWSVTAKEMLDPTLPLGHDTQLEPCFSPWQRKYCSSNETNQDRSNWHSSGKNTYLSRVFGLGGITLHMIDYAPAYTKRVVFFTYCVVDVFCKKSIFFAVNHTLGVPKWAELFAV